MLSVKITKCLILTHVYHLPQKYINLFPKYICFDGHFPIIEHSMYFGLKTIRYPFNFLSSYKYFVLNNKNKNFYGDSLQVK